MAFIDSHCHLDFAEFDASRTQLIAQCQQHSIDKLIVPGITLAQSHALIAFAAKYKGVHIAAGLHPYFLAEYQPSHLAALTEFAEQHQPQLVAIGECGIDRSIDNLALQTQIFEHHIELANQLALPLIVHHRQSHDLIAQSFKRCKPKFGGVIHAFSGSMQQAQYYIKQGFKLGVGGVITYERAQKTRSVVAALAAEHLVLETDAPSMPLAGFQGQINTPLQLPLVFEQLCQLKQITAPYKADFKKQLYESCSALFRI
ncbi:MULTISPECIES: TatD family hydrolase [Pseudoalteromonas]|uniref:TatD family hydrolase n=1 Tax=Pseudoalteromonas haloplanktis TaxID=228 RepID=A0ABU1B8X2_PSEHA|nr:MULTISPECIES: TatD family hydrolase [Pseudoalteromonas]MCF6143864.1 TatD DNase family protein [Pseudoalteromonas mariniglutinosa NCIMB 1770]MDQ9090983.1 TatD family hydrolase [Pseudoalteromonas haloplanktis]TMN65086.1 TatD family deoxyribonuclease [Pseudoalteromonas sp. S1727]BDF93361.1 deoxyribonuclease [Pseudoalteromonas sp. KAN5]